MPADAPLAARQRAADAYTPSAVRLLLIAEAPPCDTDRYFYFTHPDRHDWLFRYVYLGLTGTKADPADKPRCLEQIRRCGVLVTELHQANVSAPSAARLTPCVPGLVDRCRAIGPAHIALIKSIVYDVAFEPLTRAGFSVIDQRLPFPASGQQKRFLEGFARVVQRAGLHAHRPSR